MPGSHFGSGETRKCVARWQRQWPLLGREGCSSQRTSIDPLGEHVRRTATCPRALCQVCGQVAEASGRTDAKTPLSACWFLLLCVF